MQWLQNKLSPKLPFRMCQISILDTRTKRFSQHCARSAISFQKGICSNPSPVKYSTKYPEIIVIYFWNIFRHPKCLILMPIKRKSSFVFPKPGSKTPHRGNCLTRPKITTVKMFENIQSNYFTAKKLSLNLISAIIIYYNNDFAAEPVISRDTPTTTRWVLRTRLLGLTVHNPSSLGHSIKSKENLSNQGSKHLHHRLRRLAHVLV